MVEPTSTKYVYISPLSTRVWSSLGKAKAIYAYESNNSDELTFTEDDILSIVDMSEEELWKAEQSGVVFIVSAAYLEVVEG